MIADPKLIGWLACDALAQASHVVDGGDPQGSLCLIFDLIVVHNQQLAIFKIEKS